MLDQVVVFSLNLTLWIFLGYRFIRAVQHRKLTNGASLHAWSVFFLCYIITLLTVDAIELSIDASFDGLPVTVVVRSLLILGTAQLFFFGARPLNPKPLRAERWYLRTNPMVMSACIGIFIWYCWLRPITTVDVTHLIKGVRDTAMIVWMGIIFIPTGLQMWRQEHVRPLKVRSALNVLFYMVYTLQCGSGLAWSFSVYFVPQLEPALFIVERFTTYLCLVLVLILIFPYRWLMPLFYPRQLLLYLRLRRFAAKLQRLAHGFALAPRLPLNLTHPDEIELAIYQQVIAILDMYPLLEAEETGLKARIQQVIASQDNYVDLARQMAAIKA
jgi:hypothetical protein